MGRGRIPGRGCIWDYAIAAPNPHANGGCIRRDRDRRYVASVHRAQFESLGKHDLVDRGIDARRHADDGRRRTTSRRGVHVVAIVDPVWPGLGGRRVSGKSGECRNIDADAYANDHGYRDINLHPYDHKDTYRDKHRHLHPYANRNCHPDHNRHTADADTEQHGDLNSNAFEHGDIHVDCNPDPDTNVDPDSDGDTVDVRGVYCGSHGENDHRPEPAGNSIDQWNDHRADANRHSRRGNRWPGIGQWIHLVPAADDGVRNRLGGGDLPGVGQRAATDAIRHRDAAT